LATSELIDHYLDALHASARLALLGEEQALAQANLHAVEHRVKAGDAPALDARLTAAERQALEQELVAAQQMAINHWTSFRLRYPAATLPRFASTLGNTLPQATANTAPATATLADSPALRAIPEPRPLHGDLAHWQARLFNQQPALQQASAQLNAASAAADKARRERIPDPSLAFYSGRESFGDEAVVGLRLSMPLPGNHRNHAMRQRYAEEAIARADKEILQRSLRAEAENRYRQAHTDFQRWQLAKQMAGNLGENARLLHKAYRLGEQDLQGLLLGQQQHARAALAEVESRVQALRSYYQLQVAAGELNPFSSATNTNLNAINTSESLTGNLQ
jgi:outer membrane protein TolC